MQFTAEPLLDEEGVPLAVLTADTQAAIDELRAAARAAAAEASRAPSSERAYAADWSRRHEAEFSKHVKDRRIGSESNKQRPIGSSPAQRPGSDPKAPVARDGCPQGGNTSG
jgi:hypothetical protein